MQYHGHKAVRQALTILLQGSQVEMQRFAASQCVSATDLEKLKERIAGGCSWLHGAPLQQVKVQAVLACAVASSNATTAAALH